MNYTRRRLAAVIGAAATAAAQPAAPKPRLASKTYNFDELPVKVNGENRGRKVMEGTMHSGFAIESHITDLAPGLMPHAPHHHEHEEIMMLREGTLEVHIGDKQWTANPGAVTFVASNEEHSWKNVGTTRAIYYIVEMRGL